MFNLFSVALAEEAVEAEVTETVAEVTEAAPSWFQSAFKKLISFQWWGWVIVAVLLIGGLLIYRQQKSKKTVWTTQMLAVGAVCMALSIVLSRIRLFTMPNGGSVTPASMLPLMLYAYIYGVGPGLMLGAVHGVLDYIFGGWFLSVPQVLLDYPIAFAMLGLAGLTRHMKNEKLGLTLGVIIGSFARYMAAVLAGVVFWAENRTGWEAWAYSLGYNGTYMGIECVICVVLAVAIGPRLVRELRKVA